jgi:hypothetical protein
MVAVAAEKGRAENRAINPISKRGEQVNRIWIPMMNKIQFRVLSFKFWNALRAYRIYIIGRIHQLVTHNSKLKTEYHYGTLLHSINPNVVVRSWSMD